MTRISAALSTLIFCLATVVATAGPQPVDPPTLPVLKEGPWAGKHAAFYTDTFEAVINPDASLSVHFKAWGTLQANVPPVTMRLICFYHDDGGVEANYRARTRYRHIESFTRTADPQEFNKSRSITIEGTLEGGIPFRVKYSFEKNRVEATGGVDDPMNPYPSQPSIRVEMPRGVANPVDRGELKSLVGDYHLDIQRFDGTNFHWEEYTYVDAPSLAHAVYRTKVYGQWGPRELTFETSHPGGLKGFGEGHNRAPQQLWRGYNFWLELQDDSLKSTGRTLTLDVE